MWERTLRRTATGLCVVMALLGASACARSGQATTARPAGAPHVLRYGVLGDSYSNGQSVSPRSAWPVLLAKLLDQHGLPVQVVENPSVTGATTADMLNIGLAALRASHPDVMTVMLGVNDQVQGHTTAQFRSDYTRALKDAIAITGSPRRVLAIDIPDYGVTPAGAEYGTPSQISAAINAFNRVVYSVAAALKVQVVSIVAISRRDGAADLAGDGLHPSAIQLMQWAQHIEPVALRAWRGFLR